MKSLEFYMNEALKEAKKALKKNEVPIGAIICNASGKIIARSYNKRIKNCDATAHAEVLAIRKAGKKLKDFRLENCEMFVTLEPCPMCAGAIVNSRIRKVYFGAKSDRVEKELNNQIFQSEKLNHKCEVIGGILEEECSRIVKDFFGKKRGA